MKKIEISGEEIEFLEEKDLDSLFERLSKVAEEKGVSKKIVSKAKKSLLKTTKKLEKKVNKGKTRTSEPLRNLRQSTRDLEHIVNEPSSYAPNVIKELLKSF